MSIFVIATMDTKADELGYVVSRLRDTGLDAKSVDVSAAQGEGHPAADIPRDTVLDGASLPTSSRGDAVTAMGEALTRYLVDAHERGEVSGVLGLGGSGGTALITAAMRELPIGMPKLMVSTVASGNVAPYVDCSDITMMYSVVDIAGLNSVSERVLANAAHAMAGMVAHRAPASRAKPCLGLTMFGVTTPCVTAVRKTLEARGYDCLVFHATGSGGRAMENLVRSGLIGGALDITTTEVADELVGGILTAGPQRLDALVEAGIPLVLSVGAVDMVNFGAIDTVPEPFRQRNLHIHNAQVTLMRTTVEENQRIAEFIAAKLNRATTPFTLLLPEGGVSMLDAPDAPFHDAEADEMLFQTLETEINAHSDRLVRRLPYHINDSEFSDALVQHYVELTR